MKIRTADTAVGDLDIDIVLVPGLGLERAPLHLAVDRFGILAQPALELVIGRHSEYEFF